MDQVFANDISSASVGEVDCVAVAHALHDREELVFLHEVIAGVQVFLAEFPCLIRGEDSAAHADVIRDFLVPAGGPSLAGAFNSGPAAQGDGDVGNVVDQVFANPVFSALPDKDGRAVPFDFADVMDVVVGERVVFVHILGAGAVAGENHSRTAEMVEQRALDGDLLRMQVKADRVVAARHEVAVRDRAILCAAKAQHRIRRVKIIPGVLKNLAHHVVGKAHAVGMLEGEARKMNSAHRSVRRAIIVNRSFHPDHLGNQWQDHIPRFTVIVGPVVEFALVGMHDPLAGRIEFGQHVFHPQAVGRGFPVADATERVRVGFGFGRIGFFVNREQRHDVHCPRCGGAGDNLGMADVRIVFESARRELDEIGRRGMPLILFAGDKALAACAGQAFVAVIQGERIPGNRQVGYPDVAGEFGFFPSGDRNATAQNGVFVGFIAPGHAPSFRSPVLLTEDQCFRNPIGSLREIDRDVAAVGFEGFADEFAGFHQRGQRAFPRAGVVIAAAGRDMKVGGLQCGTQDGYADKGG